jgi:hypothetical protein
MYGEAVRRYPALLNYILIYIFYGRQRRSEKAAELAQRKARKYARRNDEEQISDSYGGSERPESEEGIDSRIEERHIRKNRVMNMEFREEVQTTAIQRSRYTLSSYATGDRQNGSRPVRHDYSRGPPVCGPSRVTQTQDQDVEMDQDSDTDSGSSSIGQVKRQCSVGVTDLDSAAGR